LIEGSDLPNFALVALPTVIASASKANALVSTFDVTSGDFAGAWLQS
jgi:peptide/nickel transport system substrate-binding protein